MYLFTLPSIIDERIPQMKKSKPIYIFILVLLLPAFVFAQQDSTKQTFKIGDIGTVLSCKYSQTGSRYQAPEVNVSELVANPTLSIHGIDSARVVSFTMAIQIANGRWINSSSSNDSLSKQMIDNLYQMPSGSYFIIQDVFYKNKNGQRNPATGISVKINESGEDALIKKSTKFASVGGITKSGNISFGALKRINKLTIQGGTTTDKIVSFELRTPMDTAGELLVSTNEYFTPRMKYLMQMCPNMAGVQIINVHIISNGQDCLIPGIKLNIGSED
jgi:hypothetical protein